MEKLNYDKLLAITVGTEKINYGILFGNEKIVFIKTGAAGKVGGYENKYLKMAQRIHEKIGATVICASNPDIKVATQIKADKALITKVIADRGFGNYEMYFVGTSDGGYQSLVLAQQFSQTAKYLGINSSHKGFNDFVEKMQNLPQVEKTLVYGTEDELYCEVPKLKSLNCPNLNISILEGIDHEFTNRSDDFIALIDLL